ncbi:MAG: hypothetical protein N838_03485 [Thiohalocapsa sp. PB-PSB1]|jgi:hypothetical protein|nr:MAG: hypothetical protein N838_03485 [Thiohalocapsa sp. PB-PSB1]
MTAKDIHAAYLVYLGEEHLMIDDVHVVPVMDFLTKLHQGAIIRIG